MRPDERMFIAPIAIGWACKADIFPDAMRCARVVVLEGGGAMGCRIGATSLLDVPVGRAHDLAGDVRDRHCRQRDDDGGHQAPADGSEHAWLNRRGRSSLIYRIAHRALRPSCSAERGGPSGPMSRSGRKAHIPERAPHRWDDGHCEFPRPRPGPATTPYPAAVAAVFAALSVPGIDAATLTSQAIAAWDGYVSLTESRISRELPARPAFLITSRDPGPFGDWRAKVRAGATLVRDWRPGTPMGGPSQSPTRPFTTGSVSPSCRT